MKNSSYSYLKPSPLLGVELFVELVALVVLDGLDAVGVEPPAVGVVQPNPKSYSIVDKAYNIIIIINTKNNPKPLISISQNVYTHMNAIILDHY